MASVAPEQEQNKSDEVVPKVSVIVVNRNRVELLLDCLDSLFRQDYPSFEIVVVDNGSSDGSLELLESFKSGSTLRLVQLSENLGFAGGCNAGIEAASGSLIALINNDAVAAENWIAEMVRGLQGNSNCGMVAGKILFAGTRIVDKSGHLIYWDGQNRGRGTGEPDQGQYDLPEEVLLPDGCAALYRKEALVAAGAFDSDFFAYADDADLGMRIRLLGYSCTYNPRAVARHRHSSTTGSYSLEKIYWVERNRIWLLCKNFPLPLVLLSPVFTTWRWFWNGVGFLLGRGPSGNYGQEGSARRLLGTVLRANWDGWRALPTLWRKRRSIQERRKLTRRELWSLLWRFRISARELGMKDRRPADLR